MFGALKGNRGGQRWGLTICFWAFWALGLAGLAQETAPPAETTAVAEPPPYVSQWYLGPVFKRDGLGYDSVKNQALAGENWLGLQVLHRQETWFASGGHLLFAAEDSALDVGLDVRFFWPLPLIEPYLGGELNYLTRHFGGFSLALRPGAQLHFLPMLSLDVFGQLRYDVFNATFGNGSRGDQLLWGLGLAVLYKL